MRRSAACVLGAVLVTIALWGALAWLARIPLPWAIEQKRALFGWAMLELIIAGAAVAVALARDKARAALRTAAVLITAAIIVGMCEATAAFAVIDWELVFAQIFGEDRPLRWKFEPDPGLGWKRTPNDTWVSPSISDIEGGFSMRAARLEMQRYTYDAYGFRNSTTVPQADVVLVGDSYIEGGNADDNETIARRLEAQIGRPVESMGVAGYGTLQNLINLDWNAPKLHPKVAVFFFFEGNDLYDDEKIESMWRVEEPEGSKTDRGTAQLRDYDQRAFLRNFLSYVMRWVDPILPNHAPYSGTIKAGPRKGERVLFADYAAVPWSAWIEERWNSAIETMRKAAVLERERGVKTIFVFLPIKERIYWPYVDLTRGAGMESWTFWQIREKFQDFCKDAGDGCLDLTEPFQEDLAAGGMPYLPTDSHWTREGTDLVARHLAPIIRRLLPGE